LTLSLKKIGENKNMNRTNVGISGNNYFSYGDLFDDFVGDDKILKKFEDGGLVSVHIK